MLEVFKTQPHFVPKVWGGHKLRQVFGKEVPTDEPYGESWEVADLREGQSLVASGHFEGEMLGALVDRFRERLVGTASPDGRFPLLVKLLDAAADLSVQVHPGPDDLDRRPGAASKDECWLILDVDDGGSILHGFREEVTDHEFLDAIAEDTVIELLRRVDVAPGDVFRVAPGTVHAICAGVALLEIQQPSDTTYRVYDYARPGLDGKPRPLHVKDAAAVAKLEPSLPDDRGLDEAAGSMLPGARVLANVDAYRIERLETDENTSWRVAEHTPQVLHMLRGEAYIDDVRLSPAETAIVPASLGRVWLTHPADCELVVAGLGGPPLLGS